MSCLTNLGLPIRYLTPSTPHYINKGEYLGIAYKVRIKGYFATLFLMIFNQQILRRKYGCYAWQ